MLRNLGTLVLLLLLATPIATMAQSTGKLAGRVVDDLGDPLPGANVVVEGTQLGAATDIDGQYFIIGIPIGEYSVTASFVGYQPQTFEGVQISSGYTTEQDFELGSDIALGEIVVEYERPIIQRDAIGVPKVVTGEQIQNLPIRGVSNVAAIQSGVVNSGRDDDLFVRGGREEEVAYYVDGVKVIGNPGGANTASAGPGVNQGAIAEQEILIGTIPARYGDAQSGIVSVTTKSGGTEFFGSAEFVTSEVLDAYGYNLGSLSIGGPIVPGRVNFFVSGQGTFESDYNTYSVDTYQLSDSDFDFLQQNPQVISLVNADGDRQFVPISPSDLGEGVTIEEVAAILGGQIPEGFNIDPVRPIVNAPETYTADRFELERGKDAPQENYTINGNLNFVLSSALNLRVGGGYQRNQREEYLFGNSLYNRNAFYNDERDSWRLYGTFRQRLSNNAFYQIQAEYQDFKFVQYPNGFSDDIREALFYGDIDSGVYGDIARRYYRYDVGSGTFERQFDADAGPRPTSAFGSVSSLPGATLTRYLQQHDQQFRISGSATTQLGVHQIEFGGEFEQQTRRFFDIAGRSLAAYYADDSGVENTVDGLPEGGVTSYEQLPFEALRNITVTRYGYDYLGLNEVDNQDIDGYFDRTNTNVAPYEPIYYAGYVQDKIEFRDLVINLGLRVDVFDNNTQVLRDVFAVVPIERAGLLGDDRPLGVDSDWAVYYSGESVVGFRDLDGNFFDSEGAPTTQSAVAALGGNVRETDEPRSAAFEDYEPQVTFMPRIGVSFPVTDRALFFASYNVTSQRPTERAFSSFLDYEEITGQDREDNASLEPERTTQYELGFRQRVGERAAFTLSGFYRTQEDKISVRALFGGFPAYSTFLNRDFTTTRGVEIGFDLRRTNNLSVNANYTLSFASGTGSDASSTGTVAWRGNFFPDFISPSDFDQRHTANASVDYRFGDDEGPMIGGARVFENFGVNLLGVFASGQRYTPLDGVTQFDVNADFTNPVAGEINSQTLPSSFRLDLRVDRSFDLGFAGSRLKAYVWVQNLLDTENIVAVYRASGLADNDGWLMTSDGQNFVNSQASPESAVFNYSAYVGGPVNIGGQQTSGGGFFYGPPRRIRLGLLLDF